MVLRAMNALNVLGRRARITLVWTLAHIGTIGNERADELAKDGAGKSVGDTEVGAPLSYIKGLIEEEIRKKWNAEWNVYGHARQMKQFFPEVNKKLSKSIMLLSRHNVGRLIRLTSGHNVLNYHMSLTTPGVDPKCRFCGEEKETFFHFVTECPRLHSYRGQNFNNFNGPDLKKWIPEEIVQFSNIPEISDAIDYYNWAEESNNSYMSSSSE